MCLNALTMRKYYVFRIESKILMKLWISIEKIISGFLRLQYELTLDYMLLKVFEDSYHERK